MSERDRSGFGAAWRVSEFRALWSAEVISVFGDQVARVALSLLVFARTSSALLTALTYALTFIPSVLGGVLLSGLADRFPRRRVLVLTDLVRAALAAVMAVPGVPLVWLWVCVALLSAAAGPFKAAQLSLLPQVLGEDRYMSGVGLRQAGSQCAQLAGFAGGGLLLSVWAPTVGLAIDAGTFVLSAVLVVVGVRSRPAPQQDRTDDAKESAPSVAEDVARRGQLAVVRSMFALACLIGLYVVPEGVAAPYSHALGAFTLGVGLLMAADPAGSVLGAWLNSCWRRTNSTSLVAALAIAAGAPLVVCLLRPGLVLSVLLWALSGALSTAYLVRLQALIVSVVPDHRRGRVLGRLSACLYASQGVAIVLGGGLAQVSTPYAAVAAAGAAAMVLAGVVGVWTSVVRPRRGDAEDEPLPVSSAQDSDQPDHRSLLRMGSTPLQRSDGLRDPAPTQDG